MLSHLKDSPYLVLDSALLSEVMESITQGKRGMAIVVDDALHVMGIVTDGIIRRAMLKGAIMETPVSQIMGTNVVVANKGDLREEFLNANPALNVIPVVENNVVADLIVR